MLRVHAAVEPHRVLEGEVAEVGFVHQVLLDELVHLLDDPGRLGAETSRHSGGGLGQHAAGSHIGQRIASKLPSGLGVFPHRGLRLVEFPGEILNVLLNLVRGRKDVAG